MSQDSEDRTNSLSGRFGLYSLPDKSALTARQTQKLIDSLDVIYGFDLAQVILLISKKKISGYLNIISEKNELYGIGFSSGSIVQVDNPDQTTAVGQLLIADQYVTESELTDLLKSNTSPLGEELIKIDKITPQQLIDILLKQATLRLTQLINSKSIQISFSYADVQPNEISISYNQIVKLSYDWVFTCVTDQWLNMHYFEFRNSELVIQMNRLKSEYPEIYSQLTDVCGKDFVPVFLAHNKIRLLESDFKSTVLLRLVHELTLIDCLQITTEKKNKIVEKDILSFITLFEKSNPYEKLNQLAVFTKSSMNEPGLIFERFNETIKSLKIDETLRNNLNRAVINFILDAEQIKLAKADSSDEEEKIVAIKNEAKDLIHQKKYFAAFSVLKTLNENQMKSSKIELYALWCLIGHALDSGIKIDLAHLKSRMNNIRPEDRYEAEYFYVMALYHTYLKNKGEAKQYYLKSCSMNLKFKDFPLRTENIFSKLKNFFKFSFFLAILLLIQAPKVEAQNTPSKENQKGPIQFTNQYYKYAVAKNVVELAGLTIDLNNLEKTMSELEMEKDKDSCYQKITENYEFRICMTVENQPIAPAQVLINDEPADSAGAVILQDLRKFIKLNIKINDFSVIEFKARRRSIAPYKVYKAKDENVTKFTFIDLNNRKNIWEKTLGTDVLTFRLESVTEDSYSIFQDYIYISPQPKKEEFDFSLKLPIEIQYAYNRFGLNGLIGFSSFTTSTSTYTSTLNSAVGFGLKVLYERNLDRTRTVYTNIAMYTAQITDERKSVVLVNKNFNLIDFNIGYKTYYDLNWSLNYELNFRNHFTSQETSTNSGQYEILQSYTGSVGASPEYTLLETRQFNFIADASAGLILPQTTTYGQTQIGYAWGLGLKTTYKLKSSRLYAGVNYDDRIFKTSDASFSNKDFIYSLGYYYLF